MMIFLQWMMMIYDEVVQPAIVLLMKRQQYFAVMLSSRSHFRYSPVACP
jgi:hypothetical protein